MPKRYPLVNGNLTLPKLTSGGTASYVGETSKIPTSKAKSGSVKGSAKKLAAIIPISNDLIRHAGLGVDAAYREDMYGCFGQTEDVTFFRATGSQYTPKGLRYQALAANVVDSSILKAKIDTPDSTTSVLKAVLADLTGMLKRMADSNVRFLRLGWGMSRRTEFFLKFAVLDGLGRPYFKDEMDKGMLMGYPYRATTVIPNNLGTSGYDSEIYLADFSDVIIADDPTIAIEVSNEASYVDAEGIEHSAFQEDVTLIRMIEEHDLMVRHEESIQVLTGVQYGA
jgi:HK97 family phage major capsid protein